MGKRRPSFTVNSQNMSVSQADVQRFGHNILWLSCGVFLVKSRHFGLPLAQTTMAKLEISSKLVARLAIQTWKV